jgi:hypothetical protein
VRGLCGTFLFGFLLGCAGAGDPIVDVSEDAGAIDVEDAGAVDAPHYSSFCFNTNKDPGETDFDCGGNCPQCALGLACVMKSDCAKGDCVSFICASPASCSNSKRDNKETDVDCGGADCPTCAATKKCTQNSDCASASCVADVCG